MAINSNYSEDTGYVNIHGRDVRVLVCERTGQIVIPIDELKDIGFRIYRKSQYSRLLIDDNQFNKEFDLFMLQSAKTFMLENKIVFKENDILESINKCKKMLVEIKNKPQSTPATNFIKSHIIEENAAQGITITSSNHELPSTGLNIHGDRKSFFDKSSPASSVHSFDGRRSAQFNDSRRSNSFDTRQTNLGNEGNSEQRNRPSNNSGARNSFDQRKPNNFNMDNSGRRESFNRNNAFDQKRSNTFENADKQNSFEKNNGFEQKKTSPNTSFELRKPKSFNHDQMLPNKNSGQDNQIKRDVASEEPQEKKLVFAQLEKPEHTVLITHIEKSNCFWVQDVSNTEILLDIDAKVKEEVEKQQTNVTKYALHTVYLAPEDDLWFRCKIIKFKPLSVFFIDYGNSAQVTDIKEASEELAKIPGQAIRITFSESQSKPELFETAVIKVNKRYDNGTYFIDFKNANDSPTPKVDQTPPRAEIKQLPATPTFFTKPQPLCKLEHGQRVMIISQQNDKLALRTKECYDKLKQIEKLIEGVTTDVVKKVEVGQLVLCNKDSLKRAVVLSVQGNTVEIELLDYLERMKVDATALRHISEALAKEAVTYLVTPSIPGLNDKSTELITELIDARAKSTVVRTGNTFDLKLGEELLTEKLQPQEPSDPNRVMLKNMKWFEPKLGTGKYMVNTFRSLDNVTIGCGEAIEMHLENILRIQVEDDEPYEPNVGEVCFGSFQESWSRCVVLRIMNFRYEVQFIDFGNLEFLKSDQLRKLTEDVKDTPVLGIPCNLIGFPVVKNVEELLKAQLVEGESYDVNVKKYNGETYEIEVPSVYQAVRAGV